MIRSLDVAATGMTAQQINLDDVANNLANSNTTGFKTSAIVFQDLIYQTLRQSGAQSSQSTQIPIALQLGSGVTPVGTVTNFKTGTLVPSSNQYGMAINGSGFFQVLLPDGTMAYTRDGNFQLDNNRQLTTVSGFPLQPSITIPNNATSVTIGSDGTVSTTVGGVSTTAGSVLVATFANDGGLQRLGQNLFQETASSGTPTPNQPGTNGSGAIQPNYTEASNVNVVEEMVKMIETQRVYELNAKVVSTSDQMLGRLTQL